MYAAVHQQGRCPLHCRLSSNDFTQRLRVQHLNDECCWGTALRWNAGYCHDLRPPVSGITYYTEQRRSRAQRIKSFFHLSAWTKQNCSQAKPHVVIPVFPGNNCEYDSAAAFERAGADVTTLIVNNLTPAAVAESTQALVDEINKSQIVMIPGGFSGGDEPDGSAKFITAFFRAPAVTEAVRDLLKNRDGLMLGICNGFQALVKLGLVPYGDIVPMTDACPTLTFNTIGRHQSRLVRTPRPPALLLRHIR